MDIRRLVNVLVVVGMIVLALGLLFAFLPEAWWQSSRSVCAEHLRIIGTGVRHYVEHHDHYPAGTIANVDLAVPKRLSWYVEIQPLIASDAKTASIDRAKAWDAAENRAAVDKVRALLLCPASSRRGGKGEPALTTYIGMAGLGADAAELPVSEPCAGIFGYDRRTRPADIRRGIAYTVLLPETQSDIGPWAEGGPSTVRGLIVKEIPYLGMSRQYGGLHLGGANVLFVDGHVPFVSEAVDPRVLRAETTIAPRSAE